MRSPPSQAQQREPQDTAPEINKESKEPEYPYLYTPESKELSDPQNMILLEANKDNWYVVDANSAADSVIKDLLRLITLNGVDVRSYSRERLQKLLLEFVGGNEEESKASVEKLNAHYNQTLMSFPFTVLTHAAPGLESFGPFLKRADLYKKGQQILLRTEYAGLKYQTMENPYAVECIPGRLLVEFVWHPDKGFRLSQIGVSNAFLRDLLLLPRQEALAKTALYSGINQVLEEQERDILKAYESSPLLPILIEMKNLRQNAKINLSDERVMRLFVRAFVLTAEAIRNPLLREASAYRQEYAELANNLAYLCPEAKKLSELMMPFKEQAEFSYSILIATLEALKQHGAIKVLSKGISDKIARLDKLNPQEIILFIQEAWQIKNLLENDKDSQVFPAAQKEYLQFKGLASKKRWDNFLLGSEKLKGPDLLAQYFKEVYSSRPALIFLRELFSSKKEAAGIFRFFSRTPQTSLQDLPGSKWSLAYPTAPNPGSESKEEPEVRHASIQTWQAKQILNAENENTNRALPDFRRSHGLINGTEVKEDSYGELVDELLEDAVAYGQEGDKAVLKKWINYYASQEGVYALLPKLVHDGHMQEKSATSRSRYELGRNNLIQPSWYVENGRIYCSYDAEVRSLVRYDKNEKDANEKASFVKMGTNNVLEVVDEPPELSEKLEPLFRARVKIRLDLERQTNPDRTNVVPAVTSLEVGAYSDALVVNTQVVRPPSPSMKK